MLADEVRLHEHRWSASFFQRSAEIHLCYAIFFLNQLQQTILNVPAYKKGMRTHSDYRKFDDMIRMVIDCTPQQADEIDDMLQRYSCPEYNNKNNNNNNQNVGRGRIFYGSHRSNCTLMTCLVGDTTEGDHIHFIDGDDGGYAMAAKTLKRQMKEKKTQYEQSDNKRTNQPKEEIDKE